MKYVLAKFALALFTSVLGASITLLVILNADDLPYGAALAGMLLIIVGWCPTVVTAYDAVDELRDYRAHQARMRWLRAKSRRLSRYTNS